MFIAFKWCSTFGLIDDDANEEMFRHLTRSAAAPAAGGGGRWNGGARTLIILDYSFRNKNSSNDFS